jgi:hypothetical protein
MTGARSTPTSPRSAPSSSPQARSPGHSPARSGPFRSSSVPARPGRIGSRALQLAFRGLRAGCRRRVRMGEDPMRGGMCGGVWGSSYRLQAGAMHPGCGQCPSLRRRARELYNTMFAATDSLSAPGRDDRPRPGPARGRRARAGGRDALRPRCIPARPTRRLVWPRSHARAPPVWMWILVRLFRYGNWYGHLDAGITECITLGAARGPHPPPLPAAAGSDRG